MKQQSGIRLTIIAVVCGIIAAALTIVYLKQVETKYRKASKPVQQVMVQVVVPKADLKKGSIITPQLVASRQVPKEFLPSNAVLAQDFKKLVNRTILMPLQVGRPITWEAVTGKSAKTFSENIEFGRRTRSVKVNKIDSFDGLLRPGDRIDLMGNFTMTSLGLAQSNSTNSNPEDIVMPILENVEVLAAGKEDLHGRKYEYSNTKNSADGFNMEFTIIALNLTPKQIARVELAEGLGDMFAVLRHPKDTSLADFEYVGVDLLFEKDEPEKLDLVIGEDGKAIGKIIGDNIVDENGNIVGKVVNGKPVSFDGKALGTVVSGVDANDPLLKVAEVADVIRNEKGEIIGKVVDGKIVDEFGNVVGEVKNGVAVGADGKVLGRVEKGVALDINGNEVDLSGSSVADTVTVNEVVRDANGNVIGTIVDGKVVDANGKVVGQIKNGKVIDANGRVIADDVSVAREAANADVVVRDANGNVIGTIVDGKVVDANGNVVGEVKDGKVVDADGNVIAENVVVAAEAPDSKAVVRDANGNVIGTIVDGKVVDANGNVVGEVKDGKVVDAEGNVIAENVAVAVEAAGSQAVVRDANGNVIGTIVDGKVVDANGNVVGEVKDGKVVDANGKVIADNVVVAAEAPGTEAVVRDANGNVIGTIVDGKVVDADGNVIGTVKDGKVVDVNGKVIAEDVSIKAETAIQQSSAELVAVTESEFIDFISGGKGSDGIISVIKVRKE